MNFTTKMEWKK